MLIDQSTAIEQTAGDFLNHEMLLETDVSDRLLMQYYLVLYERRPLKIEFVFYKPHDEWVFQNLFYADPIEDLSLLTASSLAQSEKVEIKPQRLALVSPDRASSEAELTESSSVSGLELLSHQSYEMDGWFHIVGEVRNNSDEPMEFVKVVATLYDDTENITGTDYTYTELDVIPPGGKSPFETGTDEYAGTTHYNLQVQGSPGELPRQDLVINSHDQYEDNGWLRVRGEVQNTGDSPAEFVRIIVTLYDAAGNVVGTDYAYTDLDLLPPGGTSPFETGTDHFPGFDHYEIYVQGQ